MLTYLGLRNCSSIAAEPRAAEEGKVTGADRLGVSVVACRDRPTVSDPLSPPSLPATLSKLELHFERR